MNKIMPVMTNQSPKFTVLNIIATFRQVDNIIYTTFIKKVTQGCGLFLITSYIHMYYFKGHCCFNNDLSITVYFFFKYFTLKNLN